MRTVKRPQFERLTLMEVDAATRSRRRPDFIELRAAGIDEDAPAPRLRRRVLWLAVTTLVAIGLFIIVYLG